MNDGLFAAAAAGAGLCEVASARLASERGGCDEVKKFAAQMIGDHTKANQELMTLAAEKRMALPNTVPINGQAEEVALGGLSGEHFDKCYIKQQLAAHIQAVGLFEAEAERGQDPQLKAWAAKTLPTLKHHLHEVKAMHEQMEARAKSGEAH
jgi:putative membrane protein